MTLVTWNPAWETGIPLIDAQHRQLLMQFDALLVAIHEDRSNERIPGLLAFLGDYVNTHFSAEEEKMEVSQYPGFNGHKAIHDDMRAQVAKLADDYQTDPSVMTEKVLDYLTDWLIDHINEHDRKMARHLVRFETGASRSSS
jgi:hemerythrin